MKYHTSRRMQQGSAHAVVVICLVLVLLAALGWIFWQNFVGKDEGSPANTDATTPKQEEVKEEQSIEKEKSADATVQQTFKMTHNGDTFSFSYPQSGWKKLAKPSLDNGECQGAIVTPGYKPSDPIARYGRIQGGARIKVCIGDIDKAGAFRKPRTTDAHGTSNIQEVKVDGKTAYFHEMAAEGDAYSYRIRFQSKTQDFTVMLESARGKATRADKDVFNGVWQSFKFE